MRPSSKTKAGNSYHSFLKTPDTFLIIFADYCLNISCRTLDNHPSPSSRNEVDNCAPFPSPPDIGKPVNGILNASQTPPSFRMANPAESRGSACGQLTCNQPIDITCRSTLGRACGLMVIRRYSTPFSLFSPSSSSMPSCDPESNRSDRKMPVPTPW